MAAITQSPNNSPVQARWRWLQRLEAQGVRPLLVLLGMVCVACLLYLYQSSTVATTAYTVAQLEARRNELFRRNEQLLKEAAELESLDRVRTEAGRLGMVAPAEVRYLQVADLPAVAPVVHAFAPGAPVAPVAGSGGEPSLLGDLWQALLRQFSAWGAQKSGSQARSP